MTAETISHYPAVENRSRVVYQVHGKDVVTIPACFLKRRKGVYGWYVLAKDVEMLGPVYRTSDSDHANSTPERIYLYVGTVKDDPRRSVAARFVGELLGPQMSSDKHQSFDTDFAVSCVIEFLCEKGVDVYFDVLSDSHGHDEEAKIAREKQPILQKVKLKQVCLHDDIKRRIAGKNFDDEIAAVGPAVLHRLKERVSKCRS